MEIEDIASKIVAAASKVHTALGPRLLESVYQKCMEYELARDGSKVECEVILPIKYDINSSQWCVRFPGVLRALAVKKFRFTYRISRP
jgi:GxxExxY protein